jgi:hypothetical protein
MFNNFILTGKIITGSPIFDDDIVISNSGNDISIGDIVGSVAVMINNNSRKN